MTRVVLSHVWQDLRRSRRHKRNSDAPRLLMAAVEAQMASIGIGLLYIDRMEFERDLDLLRARLGRKALSRAWVKGSSLTMEEAIRFALEGS